MSWPKNETKSTTQLVWRDRLKRGIIAALARDEIKRYDEDRAYEVARKRFEKMRRNL